MNVNGIIAEYNPFHNGHKYQLEESRRLTGADYTVALMSGNFVQRGAPALVDKRLRTEMALRCGADLVLELPVLYATASSEYFAAGAVALLDKLGAVTHLCFGSECGDLGPLEQIASFLADEPSWFRAALKALLKQGLSYPDARARALSMGTNSPADEAGSISPEMNSLADEAGSLSMGTNSLAAEAGSLSPEMNSLADEAGSLSMEMNSLADEAGSLSMESGAAPAADSLFSLLSSPNNILGIDYLKNIINRNSALIPVTIKRTGAGYHDPKMAPAAPGVPPVSALAIRRALQERERVREIHAHMPCEAAELLESFLARDRAMYTDHLSGILYYKLLTEQQKGYEAYLDVTRDLSNRIRGSLNRFTGFETFCGLLKTKAFTHTRISRCLLHILLGIRKEDMERGRAMDYIPYARVLGFRKSAAPLLDRIRACSSIPLITRPANAGKSLPPEAGRLWELDILASEIYKGAAREGTGRPAPHEYSIPMVIL